MTPPLRHRPHATIPNDATFMPTRPDDPSNGAIVLRDREIR
jgi:hypothetical protein